MLNHDKTKTLTLEVKEYIEDIARLIAVLNTQRKEINDNGDISEQGKEMRINELEGVYKAKAQGVVEKIVSALEEIKSTEMANENETNLENPALINAVNVVGQLQGELPSETAMRYINSFRGDKYALETLSALFDKYGIRTDISKYIFSAEQRYDQYIELAANLTHHDTSIMMPVITLRGGIISTAEKLGVEFTEEEKTPLVDLNDVYDEIAKQAMGLVV
jgi:hypothetical protein